MDYEEIDLMTDACVLDVDLPTFLNEYHLPTANGSPEKTSAGGVRNVDDVNDSDNELYTLNDFNVQDSSYFLQQQNWLDSETELQSLSNTVLFSSYQSSPSFPATTATTTAVASVPFNFKQESPNELIQPLAPSSWHENFIDIFENASLYPVNPRSEEDTFLESVLRQAETDNAVEDFLSIVDESAKNQQQNHESGLQNPQQILEEIYRECEYIETLSNSSSSPPRASESAYEFEFSDSVVQSSFDQRLLDDESTQLPFELESESGSASCTDDDEGDGDDESSTGSVFVLPADHPFFGAKFKNSKKSSAVHLHPASSTTAKKKTQNRKAASRYRSKKKLERHAVESEAKQLENRNVKLKSDVEDLEREIAYLKNFLKEIHSARNLKRANKGNVEQTAAAAAAFKSRKIRI